jgi:hypothetical protein
LFWNLGVMVVNQLIFIYYWPFVTGFTFINVVDPPCSSVRYKQWGPRLSLQE